MRALTGIQPSGKLHLGNYLGMVRPVLDLQEQGESFVFIADYHALTSVQDADQLREDIHGLALDLLACGIDPQKTVLYRQSDIPEVTELTWLLSVITPMGLLERCHSYKDKITRGITASHGLFAYPVLMASDILIVQSDVVPVGQDQKQHLEVARDIAIKFNNEFGEVFKIPEPSIRKEVAVVTGIDGQKMSKSYNNTIDLFGPLKDIKKRIMRIVTDSKTVEEPKDPDTCNLFALYRLLATDGQQNDMAERYRAGGLGYGEVKNTLFELFQSQFSGMRDRRDEWVSDPDAVREVFQGGAEQARAVAARTLEQARTAVGLE